MATATRNGRGSRVPLMTPAPDPTPIAPVNGTPQLDQAVLEVQAQAGKLVRNATGQVQNRTYSYVTLGAVTDEVLPLLVEKKLLWKVWPTTLDDGKPGLRFRMTHVPSGEYDEDTMPLPCDLTMQGLGSGITYGRRYALTSYLNLTVDEDDDGRSANTSPPAASSTPSPQPTAAPPQQSERRLTANQRSKLLEPRAKSAGLNAGQFANAILAAAGEPPRVWRNDEHAEATKNRLLDQLPARFKDAVLEQIDVAAARGES